MLRVKDCDGGKIAVVASKTPTGKRTIPVHPLLAPLIARRSASKAGIRMFTETIRGELAETAIRITEILPGLARTGIIVTRYRGDREKEQAYFDQFRMALDPEDVARVIMFALDQPPHVQIAEIMVLPVSRY